MQVNPFVEMFLQASEFIRNQEVLYVRLAIHGAVGVYLWTHSRPTCNEIATILLDHNMAAERDILLQQGKGLERICDRHLAYFPLHFPLDFPRSELGWHLAVRYQADATSHKNNRVPCREFAAYKF